MTVGVSQNAAPPRDEEEQRFFVAFDELARAVRRARGAPPRSAEGTLTLSQYALLEALSARRTARVAELADEAGVTASTATRILDTLQRRGIVRRQRAREDRRAVTVTLTDTGRDLLHAQDRWMGDRKRAFVASLAPAQRELVPELLVGLAALIDELAAGSSA
ncbi:MAG: MarR family transcriptional regulator [Actinomycetota bacterium]|nr:MarR family transcriptional regulator [Actinomycetota bacterium]